MDIVIRRIEAEDYAAVSSIMAVEIWMGKAVNDFDGKTAQFFDSVRDDADYVTFVALLNNRVVGFITASIILWIGSAICSFSVSRFVVNIKAKASVRDSLNTLRVMRQSAACLVWDCKAGFNAPPLMRFMSATVIPSRTIFTRIFERLMYK